MASTADEKLKMETTKNDAIAMEKKNSEFEKDIPLFDEVLIEQELYDSNVSFILSVVDK